MIFITLKDGRMGWAEWDELEQAFYIGEKAFSADQVVKVEEDIRPYLRNETFPWNLGDFVNKNL